MQTDGQLISRARRLFEKRQFAEAETLYRQASEQFSERPELRIMLGMCRRFQGDVKGALERIREAVELDQSNAESWFHLGRMLLEEGNRDEGRKALGRCIALDPNHALARVESGRLALEEGDTESAILALRTALRADENNVSAMSLLARILLEQNNEEEARKLAARAVQLHPEHVEAQLAMAQVFRRQKHFDFAEQCLLNALKQAPDSGQLHAELGDVLQLAGRDREALAAFARAQAAGQEGSDRVLAEVRSLHRLGLIEEGRRRLEALAAEKKLNAMALMLLAELRLASGDVDGARVLIGDIESGLPAGARLIEALIDEAMGRAEEAKARALSLHEEDDTHVRRQARLLSGRLALERADLESAQSALKLLVNTDRADMTAAWLLADIHERVGDRPGACQVLGQILDRSEGLPALQQGQIRVRLADLHDQAGDYASAAEHLSHAGWRLAPVAADAGRKSRNALHDAMADIERIPWEEIRVDDGRDEPIFVLGWPGSGRDAVVAALGAHGRIGVMAEGEADRRRLALEAPASLDELVAVDEGRIRLIRKRYFRAADGRGAKRVEPAWFEAVSLPTLARYFPGAQVVVPVAEAPDLELAWRLAGYRDIEAMLAAWERDQAMIDQLRETLPLEFIDVERGSLLSSPTDTAVQLADMLGVDSQGEMADALQQASSGLRPNGHWRHYTELIRSAPADG